MENAQNISGMTVNERLYVHGLLEKFDKACFAKDSEEIRRVLKAVEVDEDSINNIVQQFCP